MSNQQRFRMLNGYKVIYLPDHPRCMTSENWKGFIYEHIAVAELMLKRPLRSDEEVHHLDFNRCNNDPRNLLVILRSQHSKLHIWLQTTGVINMETVNENRVNSVESKSRCKTCGIPVKPKLMFCSVNCYLKSRPTKCPSKRELLTDLLQSNYVKIGIKYGVSDNTIRKWRNMLNIDKTILSQAKSKLLEGATTIGEVLEEYFNESS